MNMEKTVCKEVLFIIIVTVAIAIAIVIVMVKVVDAYECRTGIEEGGVKKTIVVCLNNQYTFNTCSVPLP